MNKMLSTPTRIKHEREITVLLTTLSEHTTACERQISELEKSLKRETTAVSNHKRAARKMEQQINALEKRVESSKEEAAALATDLKLAKAAHKALEKDVASALASCASLESRLATANAEKDSLAGELSAALAATDAVKQELSQRDAELANAQADIESYESMVSDFRETDRALRERIALLESQLSDERTKAGKDLLLRIMELETMLDAERNKVSDLQELPSVVKLETTAAAANASSVKTRRRVSGQGS